MEFKHRDIVLAALYAGMMTETVIGFSLIMYFGVKYFQELQLMTPRKIASRF